MDKYKKWVNEVLEEEYKRRVNLNKLKTIEELKRKIYKRNNTNVRK
ncbi:hypothetical protein [Clostridium botulinum]|nr:hypothetical protein [Clostridium botulinum]APC84137.1 hypothetical protein NPD12_3061 [Clostridium botulinum]EDT81478.1 hypothetical protein CBN_3000 [Clostridium botulinum NCTC 2916]MBY6773162.1 hypothetical protein [Clostridium botulinum]MBY6776779.1 hypothetical protein [Clostridium botulinum]MBY6783906.1 hypothetical protein [Clostridium botulinum]